MATAKQIAARKLFADRARAGMLKKKRVKNPVKSASQSGYIVSFFVKGERKKLAHVAKKSEANKLAKEYHDSTGRDIQIISAKDFIEEIRNKNPIAKKSLSARQYVTRPSQATKKPPSARLTTRRTKALKAPAGYFPNPILGFPFCVSAKAEGMSAFYKIAYFRDSETAVLFAKAYANLHQYLAIKVEEK